MNFRLGLVGALVLVAAPSAVHAHDIKISSATGLLANCTYQSEDPAEFEYHLGFCLGFIKAIMNTHPTHGETFCIPDELDNGGLIRVMREALYRLPPEMMGAPSHLVVGAAFEVAFPCPTDE